MPEKPVPPPKPGSLKQHSTASDRQAKPIDQPPPAVIRRPAMHLRSCRIASGIRHSPAAARFHLGRTVGRDRHHRHPGVAAAPSDSGGPRIGPPLDVLATTCKQIGLAALNFESANRRLPPGYLAGSQRNTIRKKPNENGDASGRTSSRACSRICCPTWRRRRSPICVTQTLDIGVDKHDIPLDAGRPAWSAAQAHLVRAALPLGPDRVRRRSAFLNKIYGATPAGSFEFFASSWDPNDPAMNGASSGSRTTWESPACGDGWRPNLTFDILDGAGPRNVNNELIGVFSVRSKTHLAKVTDGTSHTLMFGEAPGTAGISIPDARCRHRR